MSEYDVIEQRLTRAESDIKELYDRTNAFAVKQASTQTTLDNLLITLGELKQSVSALKERPGNAWDKLISALMGAAAAGIVAYIISKF